MIYDLPAQYPYDCANIKPGYIAVDGELNAIPINVCDLVFGVKRLNDHERNSFEGGRLGMIMTYYYSSQMPTSEFAMVGTMATIIVPNVSLNTTPANGNSTRDSIPLTSAVSIDAVQNVHPVGI